MPRAGQTTKRPNLIFVFADQLGLRHCGFGGSAEARTPQLDRLARQGVFFRQAVANSPVCAAFRASLVTGTYTTSTGMVINELRMNPHQVCLGHVLTDGGYRTAWIGKWHLWANQLGHHEEARNSFVPRGEHRLGFDGYWAAYNFHHIYRDAYYHTESPAKISYGPGVYEPDGQTDLAIEYLRGAAEEAGPFAMFLSYGTPHDPWVRRNVPRRWTDLFRGVAFPHPPNYRADNDPHADAWGRLSPAERRRLPSWRRHYYAMTANLDGNVGRLLDAIDELSLTRETIVVFTSDHGEMFGAQGRRAKNVFYDEAARIPLLVRWPDRAGRGRTCDACISTVDLMPTLLGLLGLAVPDSVEGMDLSHLALGRPGREPAAALLQNTGACAAWEDGHEWRALRDRRYTYAVYRVDGQELLFDNVRDPLQQTDLAGDRASRPVLTRMRKMLRRRLARLGDTFEACTWYREHWTDGRRNIIASARGPFPDRMPR